MMKHHSANSQDLQYQTHTHVKQKKWKTQRMVFQNETSLNNHVWTELATHSEYEVRNYTSYFSSRCWSVFKHKEKR